MFCIRRLHCAMATNPVSITSCVMEDFYASFSTSITSYMWPSQLMGLPKWLINSFKNTLVSFLGTFFPSLPFITSSTEKVGELMERDMMGAHASLTLCAAILTVLPRSMTIMILNKICQGTGIEGYLKSIGPFDDPVETIINLTLDTIEGLRNLSILLKVFQEMYTWIVEVFPCVWDYIFNGPTFKNAQEIVVQSNKDIFEKACCMKDFISKFGTLYRQAYGDEIYKTKDTIQAISGHYASDSKLAIQDPHNDLYIDPKSMENQSFTDGVDVYRMKENKESGFYPEKITDATELSKIRSSGQLKTFKVTSMDNFNTHKEKVNSLYNSVWHDYLKEKGLGVLKILTGGAGVYGAATALGYYGLLGAAGATAGTLAAPAGIVAAIGTGLYQYSDPRLKDFVSERPIFRVSYYARRTGTRKTKKRLYVNFYMFRWKKTTFLRHYDDDIHIGVNADEFERHFPVCVKRNPTHGYKQIFLCKFIPRHLKVVIRNCYHFKPQTDKSYVIKRLKI